MGNSLFHSDLLTGHELRTVGRALRRPPAVRTAVRTDGPLRRAGPTLTKGALTSPHPYLSSRGSQVVIAGT